MKLASWLQIKACTKIHDNASRTAVDLSSFGWSNRWIAERLGIPLREARELTGYYLDDEDRS